MTLAQVENVYVEVLTAGLPKVQVESVYVEALIPVATSYTSSPADAVGVTDSVDGHLTALVEHAGPFPISYGGTFSNYTNTIPIATTPLAGDVVVLVLAGIDSSSNTLLGVSGLGATWTVASDLGISTGNGHHVVVLGTGATASGNITVNSYGAGFSIAEASLVRVPGLTSPGVVLQRATTTSFGSPLSSTAQTPPAGAPVFAIASAQTATGSWTASSPAGWTLRAAHTASSTCFATAYADALTSTSHQVAFTPSGNAAVAVTQFYLADVAAISKTPADAVGVTDTATATTGMGGAPADAVGVTDSVATLAGQGASLADTVGVTDALTLERLVAQAPADVVGVTDAASSGGVSIADPIGITDSVTALLAPGAIKNDPIGITDAVTTALHQLGSVWVPYPISDTGSQVLDFSIVPTSPEEPWPFVWEGDGYSNSLWLAFTATANQILSVSLATTFDAGIEVWAGELVSDVEEELSTLGYGQGALEVAITAGQRILLRAHPLLDTETGTGTLTWSTTVRPETGVLGFVVQDELLETPGWLEISVLSAPPDSDVTLALDGGSVFYTVHTEDNGSFAGSVEVPELTVGAHTITAVDADGQTDTQPFTVTLEPQPPGTIPGGSGPTTGISVDPVIHWVLEDPMPGGLAEYAFPINPSEMSSPWPIKNLRVEHTIHGSGQDILWEGRAEPVDWTVKGAVRTQEFYEALEAYKALNRRLYVVDHHQRAWVVVFEGLTFEKKGPPGDLWFFGYTAKFKVLGGPVSLS